MPGYIKRDSRDSIGKQQSDAAKLLPFHQLQKKSLFGRMP